jgi:CAAX prenyl protease-like protein
MSSVQMRERSTERSSRWSKVHPAIPYVLPFAVFLALLAASDYLHQWFGAWEFPLRVAFLSAILWIFSRDVIDFRVTRWLATIAVGTAVFAIWVAPDVLIPGYRHHWLFENSLTGSLRSSIPEDLRDNLLVLVLRMVRATLIVPIVEELFWRAWLLRWLISPKFEEIPLGTYTASSMWISALLFASEHGPYWEVGLLAGLIYNFWMVKTKSLGDCILAHAVTNGVLSVFVILSGRWEYWL